MLNIKYIGRSQTVMVPSIGTFTKDKYRLLGGEAAQKLAKDQPELFVLELDKVKKKKKVDIVIEEKPCKHPHDAYPDFGDIKLRQLGLNPEKTESIFEIIEGDPTQISGAIEMTKKAVNIELESWRPAELEPLGGEI